MTWRRTATVVALLAAPVAAPVASAQTYTPTPAPAQSRTPAVPARRIPAGHARAGRVDSTAGKMITLYREVFSYDGDRGRDPFASLITSDEIRPVVTDLRLTTVAYDESGRSSVAVFRDLGTKEQYRVKVGSTLGRMRVVRIAPKSVTFAIEEFGFSRQQTLTLGDSTSTRTP